MRLSYQELPAALMQIGSGKETTAGTTGGFGATDLHFTSLFQNLHDSEGARLVNEMGEMIEPTTPTVVLKGLSFLLGNTLLSYYPVHNSIL